MSLSHQDQGWSLCIPRYLLSHFNIMLSQNKRGHRISKLFFLMLCPHFVSVFSRVRSRKSASPNSVFGNLGKFGKRNAAGELSADIDPDSESLKSEITKRVNSNYSAWRKSGKKRGGNNSNAIKRYYYQMWRKGT